MGSVVADMSIFGHCPAHDDFYLVVCNHCSQVVKPQAFQKHCGEEHPREEISGRAGGRAGRMVERGPLRTVSVWRSCGLKEDGAGDSLSVGGIGIIVGTSL